MKLMTEIDDYRGIINVLLPSNIKLYSGLLHMRAKKTNSTNSKIIALTTDGQNVHINCTHCCI